MSLYYKIKVFLAYIEAEEAITLKGRPKSVAAREFRRAIVRNCVANHKIVKDVVIFMYEDPIALEGVIQLEEGRMTICSNGIDPKDIKISSTGSCVFAL